MSYNITITPAAFDDIQQAINYYDEQQTGLGERFESQINDTLTSLCINPFLQVKFLNYRTILVKKFPYVIYYTLDDNNIKVHAVFNTHQDPSKRPR